MFGLSSLSTKKRQPVDESVNFYTGPQGLSISENVRSILIADEDSNVLNQLSRSFAICAKPYNIHIAQNGWDALRILSNSPVNIMLTALDMPVMNDFDLLDYAKIHYPDTQIFVMSEEEPRTIKDRLDDFRIYGYIRKPLRIEMVYSILRV